MLVLELLEALPDNPAFVWKKYVKKFKTKTCMMLLEKYCGKETDVVCPIQKTFGVSFLWKNHELILRALEIY